MDFPIDHDLHCHSRLSLCSNDPAQTAETILAHARKNGYTLQCITDHLWDASVPGANEFYTSQDIRHIQQIQPLPLDDQVRLLFGCETEYCGGTKLALAPDNYDLFDFIVIPPQPFSHDPWAGMQYGGKGGRAVGRAPGRNQPSAAAVA